MSYINVGAMKRPRWSFSMIPGILFILALVSPFVSYVGRGLVTAWIVFPIWLITMIVERPKFWQEAYAELAMRRFEVWMLLTWACVVYANAFLGRGYTGDLHVMNVTTMLMIVLMEIVYTSRRDGSRERIMIMFMLILGVEVLRSLPTLWTVPGLPRLMMLQGSGGVYGQGLLESVGEYGFYTGGAIALVAMFAFALSARERGMKVLLITACVALAVAVVLATFMGAILLMLLGFGLLSIMMPLVGKLRVKHLMPICVAIIFAIFLWTSFLRDTKQGMFFVDKLGVTSSSVSERGILEGDTTRHGLWFESWQTLWDNPMFGVGPITGRNNPALDRLVGGHSTWLDLPAQYGGLGLAPFVLFLLAATRRAIKSARLESWDIFAIARVVTLVLYFVGGTYNPIMTQQTDFYVFFFVLSGTISLPKKRRYRVTSRSDLLDLRGRSPIRLGSSY